MDPQQRLLLELTWEALEDAGLLPSKLAGSDTGVFVGASSVDHANLRLVDMAAADAYMMTGNTLSVVSNRISYIFDLHGPSFTVDTACSSSLVAVNEALQSLRGGRIDTAIVAGVNLLISPQSFIGFSQAAMLAPRGLCRAFSAQADGYVRAEGAVVLVLRTKAAAERDGNPIHGMIVDADVNSDGRTNGISLPSKAAQARLLERLYLDKGFDPAAIAFVEAHGTGTPVGDPIEALALGETLGRHRDEPLSIGSIKTNIGHMEAAAGLGGLLKAVLALEHDCLPPSLHCDELNPAIDFAALNLAVARTPMSLKRRQRRLAGVNAFGFGGTNAHVVLTDAPSAPPPDTKEAPSYLVLSAHSRAALAALAGDYAARLRDVDDTGAAVMVGAAAARRDRLAHRIVLPFGTRDAMSETLASVNGEEADVPGAACGFAPSDNARVAFVFSGNGSQFAGMGLPAYRHSAVFRHHLDDISSRFKAFAGWSIAETLHADDLAGQLRRTGVAQPLLFAIQSAACHTFRHHGLEPAVVLGHSVGEVAAAEAAGFLDRQAALHVIYSRSLYQELAYDHGGMAVVIGSLAAVEAVLAELPGLEIAAYNSSRAFTVSGCRGDLAQLAQVARRHQARIRALDLAYPFHSALMSRIEAPLVESLANLSFQEPRTPFVSTVSGGLLPACQMNANYWWRNVREPVRFAEGVARAREQDIGIFVEIGPSATLLAHIGDILDARRAPAATMSALDRRDKGVDPLAMAVASVMARGASIDATKTLGSGPGPGAKVDLPLYPWQRQPYRLAETLGSSGMSRSAGWHPLIGTRTHPDRLEWESVLDTTLHPWLADHCVDRRAILPGAALAEMALAVARQWCGTERASISDFEISSPLQLSRDTSRDILCRVSPLGRRLEISSRPRLSAAPWELHATGKIVRDPTIDTFARLDPVPTTDDWVDSTTIYAAAARAGLAYGPAFRKLARARRSHADRIVVDLTTEASLGQFGIDPTRLDACFHALALLFGDRNGVPSGSAYVPVRFGEFALYQPGVALASAQIDIRRCDRSVIIADLIVADTSGATVAVLREARFRRFQAAREADVDRQIIQRTTVVAPEPTAARRDRALSLERLRKAIVHSEPDAPLSDAYVLIEGWATSLALETACALAKDGIVNVDDLIAEGRLPQNVKSWLERSIVVLQRSGLCRIEGRTCVVQDRICLPQPDEILRILAQNHQAHAVELLVASSTQTQMRAILEGEAIARLDRLVVDFEVSANQFRAPAEALVDILRESVSAWPSDRAMRILQLGHGPLTRPLAALAASTSARLTIFEPDHRCLDRHRVAAFGDVGFVEHVEDLPFASFDLVVAASTIARCLAPAGASAALRSTMCPEAILAVIEPPSSFFRDLVVHLDACLGNTVVGMASADRSDWTTTIASLGLDAVRFDTVATSAGSASLLTARVPAERRHREGAGGVVILGRPQTCAVQTAFATLIASSGFHVSIVLDLPEIALAETTCAIVVFLHAADDEAPSERLLAQCLYLKQLAERTGERSICLWLIAEGATNDCDGVAAGLWAFSRTLANERPMLDIKRIGVAPGLPPGMLVERLCDLILSGTNETEIVLDKDATRVVRFTKESTDTSRVGTSAEAARLLRGTGGGIERLSWEATVRDAPGVGDVEVAVEAIGINFRDVMFGLGLLPDELLEDGFTGPTLGLECVGSILRVGLGVTTVKMGDRVMVFARNAFATHVVTKASLVAPIPAFLTSEAAATIPVAFMTAYYGLMIRAQLKPGEWVLIHGGAGGVGLAAAQIARWRGARIIATAGSPGRRALLRALGVEHAFDSRSGSFIDDVRRVTGAGVDIVLNSLSGDAMERSIAVLRPFGRFVELGKRDYVADTHVGLRPFRRNLAYFGVDLDQLLARDPATCRRLFRKVVRLFERGKLLPLPFRVVEATETIDAFRLMQQSGHIGKLIVRPPDPATLAASRPQRAFAVASDKTHLVTGGFGGFGLATAKWLVSVGARTIMLVGRSGSARKEVRATLDDIVAQDVRIVEETADVADPIAMQRIFGRFGHDLPPLGGVIHAAMVLDDSLITNLEPNRIARVLRPKVAGADTLDGLTRQIPLDYFVLYSSVTSLIGNPGQAAYVAANGYMEGLARRRRCDGLPALAVAWGAIADAGILAESESARELLHSRAGVMSMPATEALGRLGDVLAAPDEHDAVVAIAPINWSKASRHLSLLGTPPYRGLVKHGEAAAKTTEKIDIAALVAGVTPQAARKTVSGLIVEEIARVLRLPREDVALTAPLAEIGLDSLMAVELALGLEGRFKLAAPLSTTASSFSVNELADHIIAVASGETGPEDVFARRLIERHVDIGADGRSDDPVRDLDPLSGLRPATSEIG